MNRLYIVLLSFFKITCLPFVANAQHEISTAKLSVIPYPSHLQPARGAFIITKATTIVSDNLFINEAAYLQHLIKNASGYSLSIANKAGVTNVIELQAGDNIAADEGYTIDIGPEKIILTAKTTEGMYHGIQTIRQLLPVTAETPAVKFKNISLSSATIHDAPVYGWRGLHLDVSRHFFSIAYLKKLVDAMALYKMNKLHLHLTDDQGWRIEIKKYPKLTEEGAWRTFNNQDSECIKMASDNPDMAIDTTHIIYRDGKKLYGGFYTQEQMKDFVKYASARYIDVIPEIDMPGHMMAAIHSYPFISCDDGSKWGELFSTPICPCKESTYEFAENVFSEIMDIFPSQYIHLGADEVDRKTWASSADCQELMQKEGLTNVAELQSYFVRRMEKFFQSKGRKLIGWDEILEGGISPTANVMYWRSWVPDAPIIAAKNGNHVIMSPGNPLYFDSPPDAYSLVNIYHFDVVPKKLNSKEAAFIIGAQANLWTEHVPSENRADYLYFPRMISLAERLWSTKLDFNSFTGRLKFQYPRLDALHIHYRLPDLTGIAEENVFTDKAVLNIRKPFPGAIIHYTIDGSIPGTSSLVLSKPLIIDKPLTIKAAAFNTAGLRGDIYTMHYKKDSYASPLVPRASLKNGLACNYYKQFFKTANSLKTTKPDSIFITKDFIVPASVNAPSFGLQYKGFIDVPETGIYTFYLTCDDGGILTVANREVVNNDGLHSAIQKTGQIALKKGLQPFQLNFIEGGGGYKLELKYSKGYGAAKDLPADWLKY